VITGHYKPDKGEIVFQGQGIDGLLPHQIFQKKIYRTFQITREFSQMTVLENVMLMPDQQIGEKVGKRRLLKRRPSRSLNLLS